MTGRDRVAAALSKTGSVEVPAVICYEGIYIRDHWSALTDFPWWYGQSPSVDHQVAWREDVMQAIPQDWFALASCASREDRRFTKVEAEGGSAEMLDIRTGDRRPLQRPTVSGWAPGGGLHSNHPDRAPETKEEIIARIPDPDGPDPEQLRSLGCFDLADSLLAGPGKDLYPMSYVTSPLWGCYGLWGFEEMMMKMALDPELVTFAGSRILEHGLQTVRRAAAMGAEGIWIEECYTDLINPEAFQAINVPLVTRLVDEIRSLGMKSIYYYCGDPSSRWDHLFSAGADALSLEEGKKGFSIDIAEAVSRSNGRGALLGNLDAIGMLPEGSEEELKDEISRQIEAGRRNGNRFIMSIGSPPTPETPPDRIRLYYDLVRRLGSP